MGYIKLGVVHDIPLLWNLQGTNILMVGVGISPSQKNAMISSLNMTNPSGATWFQSRGNRKGRYQILTWTPVAVEF